MLCGEHIRRVVQVLIEGIIAADFISNQCFLFQSHYFMSTSIYHDINHHIGLRTSMSIYDMKLCNIKTLSV